MNYYSRKKELTNRAVRHINKMSEQYSDKIIFSIKNTTVYGPTSNVTTGNGHKVELIVEQTDSVSAVLKHAKEGIKPVVANFASYKIPGGMFLQGSKAQEECLCHESTLYNVISYFKDYYAWNNANKNKALYTNRALYSESIFFKRNTESMFCDVITCAAPNYSAAAKYQLISPEENLITLRSRIRFIKWILEQKGVDVFIFGAFGCGVFGQHPQIVAQICKEEFVKSDTIKKVYFSIIDEKTANVFRAIIEKS